MTTESSVLRTVLTVVAVLLSIPMLMMGIVMPVMGVAGAGHVSPGAGGWMLLLPLLPLTVFVLVSYTLYRIVSDGSGQDSETTGDRGMAYE